jgi:hypothetical protein
MRYIIFVCIPIFFFRLSIELGRLVGLMPLGYQKNSFSCFSSVDRFVVHGVYTVDIDQFVTSLLDVSHCTVFLYLLLGWSTFNRALLSLHV